MSGHTWPEQDAVVAWLAETGVYITSEQRQKLANAVSRYRIEKEAEIARLRARCEELEGMEKEVRFYHPGNPVGYYAKILAERDRLREALTRAEGDARILAHCYQTDSRPPDAVVLRAITYDAGRAALRG